MRPVAAALAALALPLMFPLTLFAQTSQSSPLAVPRAITVAGIFQPVDGQPAAAEEVVTVSIFADEAGGAPLWQETQSVRVDAAGRYSLILGATQPDGIPLEAMASGGQWLGVLFARPGEVEGPRTRLTSVPYALRAADADTLGGRPASSYVLAPPGAGPGELTAAASASSIVPLAGVDVLMGTTNKLAKYLDPAKVGDSSVYESGGFVGIGTTNPRDALHVRFSNDNGTLTGYAVQNLEANPSAYSGMLFYDDLGALGLFQGFNNLSHEYRINNVARTGLGAFDGSINFMIGSASALKVNSAGNIGIGTSTPATHFEVSKSGGAEVFATAYIGAAAPGTLISPVFQGRTARGTRAAPTAVQNGDLLAMFSGGGYGTSTFFPSRGSIAVRAAETWTNSAQGTYLRVSVTNTGTATTEEVMGINPNGFVAIGPGASLGSAADRLQVFGDIRVGTAGSNGCINDFSGSAIAGVCSSDARLKKDVTPFGPALGPLTALRPVRYSWRADEFPDRRFGHDRASGLIAQEVELVLPELVVTGGDGFKAVDYRQLPLLTIQALKELKAENDALTARVAALERLIKELAAGKATAAP